MLINKKIIAVIIFALLLFGVIYNVVFLKKEVINLPAESSSKEISQVSEKDKPQIISTKPDPLERTIVSANETIEITFNRPLENVGEFKVRIDPKVEFKLELSSDRKTGKIIPVKAYELGQGYTIFIGAESKFDGIGRWGEEKIYHFRTIKYRGI